MEGIWASAPYFHNGCAPTLASVLGIEPRDQPWLKSNDPLAYDFERVGLRASPVSGHTNLDGEIAPRDARRFRRVYDTTQPGRTCGGHDFAAGLQIHDQEAVLEYLKLF